MKRLTKLFAFFCWINQVSRNINDIKLSTLGLIPSFQTRPFIAIRSTRALKLIFFTDRDLEPPHLLETSKNGVKASSNKLPRVGFLTKQILGTVFIGLTPNGLGLRLDTCYTIKNATAFIKNAK